MAVKTKRKLIGEKLLEKGLITREQLERALEEQARSGGLLGKILVKLGMVAEGELNCALSADRFSESEPVDLEVLKEVPEQLIRKYRVFPFKREGEKLLVAMADTYNVLAQDDLRLLTGYEIEPVMSSEREITALIDRYLGMPEIENALKEIDQEVDDDSGETVEENIGGEGPVIRLVNGLLLRAVGDDASDIHIEPSERCLTVRFRIDGVLRQVMKMPRRMTHALVTRIKVMASLDIAERRVPQDGRIPLKMFEHDIDLRVSTMPTIFGEKVVIRLLNKENIKKYDLSDLGFSDYNYRMFKKFLDSPYGMILVTGPTGSGKTTTLYTALKSINSLEKNVVTVEDPVEYVLEGTNQTQVNVKTGATFATYLRSILRQDPDVIMVGEIRDLETAEIAIRSSATGHLVLSTLHTSDAPGALTRLVDMGVKPFMVASATLGVVGQRLVRRICPNCREEYRLGEAERAFAGTTESDVFFHGKGCDLCNRTGYRGRLAIHEILVVDATIQKLIISAVPSDQLRAAAIQQGMVTLKEDGLQKARLGLTTVQEIMRTV